jgi:pyruvate formate lyase activating enzyme
VTEEAAKRRGFIDAVVITGGEPTMQHDLIDLMIELKENGLLIKLDTNGSRPEIIRELIAERCVDYIAMDIKTSWSKYSLAAGVDVDTKRLASSVDIIKSGNTDYEFRTTCVPGLVEEDDVIAISRIAGERSKYTLQQFSNENTLDPEYRKIAPYSAEELQNFLASAKNYAGSCRLIGV